MSIRVMTLVWEHSKQTGNALLLLLAIADFADDNGVAFPSVSTLANKSRMSKRNVNYVLNELEQAAELKIDRGSGSRAGTNRYTVVVSPTRELFDEPATARIAGGAKAARGAKSAAPLQQLLQDPPATAIAPEPSLTVSRTVKEAGPGKEPSPVATCFKIYQTGIQQKYGGTYPPSAKANGQLANVVARVGGEAAPEVVRAYLASQNAYYAKRQHPLDVLVKDCEQIYLALQRSSGTAAPQAPTIAKVALLAADGRVIRHLDDQPAGKMDEIAMRALRAYSKMIGNLNPKYVAVRQGPERRQYAIDELQQAASAHA